MSGAPAPVSNATGLYIGAVLMVIIWAWALSRFNYLSKDSFQIITVITTAAGLATWLLWLCAWMHQWHPLITPEWKADE